MAFMSNTTAEKVVGAKKGREPFFRASTGHSSVSSAMWPMRSRIDEEPQAKVVKLARILHRDRDYRELDQV
jgi:hypothetical protein